nr:universal stress protein [Paenibacillus chinjuensis]
MLKYARDTEQQLIIIGSRGLSGIKEMMLGSVSHKVSQLSNCPVLIVY